MRCDGTKVNLHGFMFQCRSNKATYKERGTVYCKECAPSEIKKANIVKTRKRINELKGGLVEMRYELAEMEENKQCIHNEIRWAKGRIQKSKEYLARVGGDRR